MATTAEELREEVRRRYAESARAVTEDRRLRLRQRLLLRRGRERRREFVRGALRRRAARRAPRRGGARLARLRQPDRGRRAARGRDGARPRLRRRHRRDPVGKARRPDRHRLRARHDRRDARARAAATRRGRRPNVHFLKGVIEQIPLPASSRRRGDLELRDQPLDRQAGRADRDRARAQAGRADRDQRHRRRGPPDGRPSARERGSYVGCIAGALSKGEYEAGLEAAGFEDVSVEFTHQVADGMHGAIVKARQDEDAAAKGLPVIQPAAKAGCC